MENNIKHIAVIIDGNRRYAQSRGLQTFKGHEAGADKIEEFLDWCEEAGIKEITIYALSTENLKREKQELDYLFKLFKKFFKKIKEDKKIHEKKIGIRFIGDLSLVHEDIRELAQELEKDTKDYNNHRINFCFAYGGRLELINAFNRLKGKKGKITEQDITNALWLSSEPDLIIRTGGKIRTSNFLPWQSVYSEWMFFDKMWPEFTKEDFNKAISNFSLIRRNFGK